MIITLIELKRLGDKQVLVLVLLLKGNPYTNVWFKWS